MDTGTIHDRREEGKRKDANRGTEPGRRCAGADDQVLLARGTTPPGRAEQPEPGVVRRTTPSPAATDPGTGRPRPSSDRPSEDHHRRAGLEDLAPARADRPRPLRDHAAPPTDFVIRGPGRLLR